MQQQVPVRQAGDPVKRHLSKSRKLEDPQVLTRREGQDREFALAQEDQIGSKAGEFCQRLRDVVAPLFLNAYRHSQFVRAERKCLAVEI